MDLPKWTTLLSGPLSQGVRGLGGVIKELGHASIDVLKVDIEGGEFELVEALAKEIGVTFDHFLVEVHNPHLLEVKPPRVCAHLAHLLKNIPRCSMCALQCRIVNSFSLFHGCRGGQITV